MGVGARMATSTNVKGRERGLEAVCAEEPQAVGCGGG